MEEFLEDFGIYKALLLFNFFSGYNQVPLNIKSQDLIIFITTLNLFYIYMFPQDTTNLVTQFIRVIM